MLPFRSPSPQKNFFSDKFNLSLHFHHNGGVTGKFFPFASMPKFESEVKGLYSVIKSNIVVFFSCEFINANLTTTTEINFLGEIIKYDNTHECLIIRWLMNQEIFGARWMDRDCEILLDARYDDARHEITKAKNHIEKNALEVVVN